MPHLIDRCFAAAGVDGRELLTLRPVDPMYRASFADGTELRVRHGREAMTEEIRTVCGAHEAEAFGRFADWLRQLYDLEMPGFIERSYDSPLDLARPLGPALELVRLGAFRRLAKVVARYFDDERLRRVFSFQSMYAGLAPFEALAVYAVITYMDTVNGVFVPEGGIHALPVALATAAERAGATFRYGTRADRILLRHGTSGAVTGVRLLDGEILDADAVVANPDLPVAYRTLLPGLAMPRAARQRSLLAVRPRVARRRPRHAPCRYRAPQHPLRARLGWCVPRHPPRRGADAGPVAAGERALVARTVDGAA